MEAVLTQSVGTPSPWPTELGGLREANVGANTVTSWLYKVLSCSRLAVEFMSVSTCRPLRAMSYVVGLCGSTYLGTFKGD